MGKKDRAYHQPLLDLVLAHGNRNEVDFCAAAFRLIDALDAEGEDTAELVRVMGRMLAKTTKGHSLERERACRACGDIDGCHLWRIVER